MIGGFIKTLFGDARNLAIAAAAILAALAVLQTGAAAWAGLVLPVCLLAGIGFLAKR